MRAFLTSLLLLSSSFFVGSAHADISCPNTLGGDITRQLVVDSTPDAFVSPSYCQFKTGNFQGDNFSAYFPTYTLLDKDTANDTDGGFSGVFGQSGSFSLTTNYFGIYEKIYVAFHFGNGSGNPDSFIIQLTNTGTGTGSATYAFNPSQLANGLSNIYLIGTGTGGQLPCQPGDTRPECNPPGVPEPGSLALAGVALLAAGIARRRTRAAK